jgi:hypothetical protein
MKKIKLSYLGNGLWQVETPIGELLQGRFKSILKHYILWSFGY